ncbi:polysaccharide pyruvyl transferase family protein [Pseudarthrobacter quantipunctorum]|uniref:Polysaccharide pyruvyl transferase family protein n=1 Tax=Pseudarthrobacter quantipunctorum TaxID=3128980 RepID=A0ABZ2R861_9MICC
MRSRVAVIIRTKDRGRLLGRALDSVLGQTFSDWRIVIVNDGGSRAQVDDALEPRLSRIGDRLLRLDNEASLGMEAASNLGIRAVDSEFIAVHDDDDEWAPEFLATTVSYLEEHPSDGGVSVETEIVYERLTPAGRDVEERITFEPDLRDITLVDLLHYNRFVPISFLFRRSVYNELGGFDENLPVVGDWEFHLRFLVHHHIGLIKGRPLAFWNQRRAALSSEANSFIARTDEHQLYSLKVRDRLVREHAQAFGLGPLLYQRELLAVETGRLHQRLDEISRQQSEGTEQLARLMGDVEQIQRNVRAASQPLPLRALRSVRRRLRERGERQRSLGLHTSREHAVVHSAVSLGKQQRIAILGDVGQHEYHVGDEAMTHAAIAALRKRGYEKFVVLTHDVGQTSGLYGVPAAPRPEVPWNPFERHQLLQEVKHLLDGGPATERAADVVRTFQEAFSGCSTLLLAGGGNLTSQYGGLLFERLAAIRVAHSMGLKVVVSGQTVGPVLTGPDRDEAAEALRLCNVVGSRERHTHDLLTSMDVESVQVLDDAAFFSEGVDVDASALPPSGYIAATFAPGSGAMPRDDYHRHMARLLDLAYEHLQLPILLLPHVSTFGARDGDQECHAAIARLCTAPDIRVLEQRPAEETAALTANAELVISSRYHPVIFGLSAGVPVLPVAVDYYGEARIGGALESWGLKPLLRSLRHLGDGNDAKWVNSVIGQRAEIRDHLQQHGRELKAFHVGWWDAVAAALSTGSMPETLVPIPAVTNNSALIVEEAESQEAARLNASNEIAIGNLAQHTEWLQGELNQAAARPDHLGAGVAVIAQAGQKLLSRTPLPAAAKRFRTRVSR